MRPITTRRATPNKPWKIPLRKYDVLVSNDQFYTGHEILRARIAYMVYYEEREGSDRRRRGAGGWRRNRTGGGGEDTTAT
jgi:hypothetical protein